MVREGSGPPQHTAPDARCSAHRLCQLPAITLCHHTPPHPTPDSVQFEPQESEVPTGTFGLPGLTELVLTNLQGDIDSGSANASETLLRSGWFATDTCAVENEPIDPLCGLMAFPPLPEVMVSPKLCEAQAEDPSVACDGTRCVATTCAV